jgi:hypothetical protein
MANAANSAQLRAAIQNANSSDDIFLALATYSVTTLGKFSSYNSQPAVGNSGYRIVSDSLSPLIPPSQGASSSSQLDRDFSNTRIYQQNIDGPYSPGLIKDVELSYSSGSYSLLSARTGNFTLTNVKITGTHSGWAGNGNNYFSLINVNWAAPLSSVPITVPLTLTNVTVDISGQGNNFNGTTGGSAFLHSWNNNGPVSITNSIFDESGFASTLNLLGTLAAPTGTYTISNNLFNRNTTPANRTVRPEGNRLQNVTATLSSNTFSDGSYIDLYGNISAIAFNGGNTFNTIAGGYGIRVTSPNSLTKPTFTGTTTFTGPGLALKYESASADFINYFNASSPATNTFNVNGVNYNRLIAGGQAGDTMNLFSTLSGPPQTNAWISGDGGNDSINAGPLNDFLLGGSGNDTLRGQTGDDIIDGGIGDDFIDGMGGNDTLTGGTGADKFRYTANVQSDIVTDFNASELDQLSLAGVAFTGSTLNSTLSASSFQQIAAPTSSPWAPSATITNKVTILNTQTTTSLMNTVLATGQAAAYVMFFDGSKAWLYYDGNWSNLNPGGSDRQALACFTNITSLGALTAFNHQQFFYGS